MVSLTSALFCLAMTVYHEARGEPPSAQKVVAHVVMNRTVNRNMDVCEVVKEPRQFSWVKNGKGPKFSEDEAWYRSLLIAEKVLYRERDITNGANHFWKAGYNPDWAVSCVWQKQIQDTMYCKIPVKTSRKTLS